MNNNVNNNFKWIEFDIDNSLILKVLYNDNDYSVFNVLDVLDAVGDNLDIKTANIDDLTNLLTIGIVRFYDISNQQNIIDIPLRNLYKLYYNNGVLLEEMNNLTTTYKELEAFSVMDGSISEDYTVISYVIAEPTDDLIKLMKIASKFSSSGMQEKFDLMSEVTMINHKRIINNPRFIEELK